MSNSGHILFKPQDGNSFNFIGKAIGDGTKNYTLICGESSVVLHDVPQRGVSLDFLKDHYVLSYQADHVMIQGPDIFFESAYVGPNQDIEGYFVSKNLILDQAKVGLEVNGDLNVSFARITPPGVVQNDYDNIAGTMNNTGFYTANKARHLVVNNLNAEVNGTVDAILEGTVSVYNLKLDAAELMISDGLLGFVTPDVLSEFSAYW